MLRTAFIGAGGRARSAHYPTVTTLADVRVEAVCELDAALMAQVVEQYAIPRTFADYRRMLDEVDLDLIYVIMGEQLMAPVGDRLHERRQARVHREAGRGESGGVACVAGRRRRRMA